MPSPGHLLAFLAASLVLLAIPGPSVLFTISRALVLGRGGALLTVLGNAAGQAVQVLAVALGVGAFVERSVLAWTAIKLVGALYLVHLGIQALRHRRSLLAAMTGPATAPRSTRRVLGDGFVVGLSNPKSIIFYVAALPQFTDPDAGNPTLQLLTLGALWVCLAVVSDSVWAVAAGGARNWFAKSPGRLAAVGGAGGLAMIGLGAGLAVTGRRD
jgi:threonine/homoserine/homoserine lactone efflux protein